MDLCYFCTEHMRTKWYAIKNRTVVEVCGTCAKELENRGWEIEKSNG